MGGRTLAMGLHHYPLLNSRPAFSLTEELPRQIQCLPAACPGSQRFDGLVACFAFVFLKRLEPSIAPIVAQSALQIRLR